MDKGKKATITALLIFFFFCNLVTLSEIPLVPVNQRVTFATLKFFIVSLTLPFSWCLWKNIHTKAVIVLSGFMFLSYSVLGQYYRPLYYMAFFQCAFLYSVILPVSRTMFRVSMFIGATAFLWVLHFKWEQFIEQSSHPQFSDMVFAVFAVAIIAIIANSFFSSERSFHDDAVSRFSQIGVQSARVVHDLKGLIAAPKLHVQYLQSRMSNSPFDRESQEMLELISADLDGLKKILVELNQLTAQEMISVDWFELNDLVLSVRSLLSKQLMDIKLEMGASMGINSDRAVMTSILVNLVLNSVQNFKEQKVAAPRISVDGIKNSIFIRDNGGGFPDGILESFSREEFYSTRIGGTGLGLMLTAYGMKNMRGKIFLSNTERGAQVELRFPQRSIKQSLLVRS